MKLRLENSGLGQKDGEKLFLLLYEKRCLNQLVLAIIISVTITFFQVKLFYFLIFLVQTIPPKATLELLTLLPTDPFFLFASLPFFLCFILP